MAFCLQCPLTILSVNSHTSFKATPNVTYSVKPALITSIPRPRMSYSVLL